jgi:YidC/Oxa1 family membrane protein insertase
MDRRTILAFALIAAILFLYPVLLKLTGLERYGRQPQRPAATDTSSAPAPPPAVTTRGGAPEGAREAAPPEGSQAARPAPGSRPTPASSYFAARAPRDTAALSRSYVLENELYRAEFSAWGAHLVRVELKRYRAAHGGSERGNPGRGEVPPEERVVLAGGPTLTLDLGSDAELRPMADVPYRVEERMDAAGRAEALVFTAEDSSGARIRQVWSSRPGTYAFDLEVAIDNVPLEWRQADYTVTVRSWPLLTERNQVEDERALQSTTLVGRDLRRDHAAGLRGKVKRHDGNVVWSGVMSRYFSAVVGLDSAVGKAAVHAGSTRSLTAGDRARLGPETPPQQLVAESRLVLGLPGSSSPADRFVVYVGPRDYFLLHKLGLQLERGVDLGWSWVVPFSRLLLQLLKWLYGLIPNYGVAILLLATLVRVLFHPLSMLSMKSMRAMQKIQPEVERLRAKYKDQPQAMNQALMALYKEYKVNPAAGCLPMLLQMPIFFALYSVLFHAIELRRAPFVGWIDDLSAADALFQAGPFPIRLLPVLMTLTGLLQQKLTPTDPRQLQTMYLMNVFMLVFFYNLPSGLVLYWTVMNLLTALQQWLALREDGGHASAPAAVAQPAPVVAKKRREK